MSKGKGKFNNTKGSGPRAKGQQWGGQQWGSWNTWSKGGGKGGEMYNLEFDPHGEWCINWQIDMLSFEKGLPSTKVVDNSKVAKERSEEVTKRPHTGRDHALGGDDQSQRLLPGQDLLEMAKIKVEQGKSMRNNKWNKEQSATPPAQPKPAPTRRTTKTAANLEEAYNHQHNCSDNDNARKMTSGSASPNINGIIGCNCALKGINVLEKTWRQGN